ncbi:uncharacterized protein LOC132901855 [Amyelois transitella]|uniref:uncharacterized protein LOC132901855 n=1 Tax=Amyelois transitella TaxID=680683 RepID=UPI00299081C3|nr:uncharacterized protein LOC132901855 [Amyelois transitella]
MILNQNIQKKAYSSDYISKNMLDEDFLNVFQQFRLFQVVLGSCRIDARYRFVTTPSLYQKLYTVVIITLVFISYSGMICYAYKRYENMNYFYAFTSMNTIAHFIFYFSSIFQSRFYCNKENVKFYVKLSQVDKLIKVHYNKIISNVIKRMNWITLLALFLVICFIVGTVCVTKNPYLLIPVTVLLITHSTVLTEINFSANLIVYLGLHIQVISNMMKRHIETVETNLAVEEFSVFKKHFLKAVGTKTCNLNEFGLDDYLKRIFTAFSNFQNVYKFQIFLFTSKVVLFVVLTFEYVLLTVQTNGPDRLGLLILVTLTLTDTIGLLILCLCYEAFERDIREVKLVSIKAMSICHTGPLRDKAKIIYRTVEDTFPHFSVYDMWELDARLFIRVCNVVTGFFVTFLQLTYL